MLRFHPLLVVRGLLLWGAGVALLSTAASDGFSQTSDPVRPMETWDRGYTGGAATGPHVLGYWKFDGEGDAALVDASGKGHTLTLKGGVIASQGKFGGCLECFPGFPVDDKQHSALTPHRPGLSPAGPLTLEMWIAPKPEFADNLRCYLLDKKYVDHNDFQWQIGEADRSGNRRMWVNLGFGTESRNFFSDPVLLKPNVWRHVAFTYDGHGRGRFFVDGQLAGEQLNGAFTAPTIGTKGLSIGDRLGSNYGGFPGYIDEVRICRGVLSFEPIDLTIQSDRTVWRRMEQAESVVVRCTNLQRSPLTGARLKLLWSGGEARQVELPTLQPDETHEVKFPVDTELKPGEYLLTASCELTQPRPLSTSRSASFRIMPRPTELQMPVIMWGVGAGGVESSADQLREIGFTHCLGMGADYGRIWQAGEPTLPETESHVAQNRRILDFALAHDLSLVANLSPERFLAGDKKNLRVDRDGKAYEREDIVAADPRFPPFFRNVGASVAQAYGNHPAFSMAMLDTEVRDASQPSFNPIDRENYRKWAGSEIPAEVQYRFGVDWSKLPDFPPDRVISPDHPILKYYRWFWTVGDGWNGLHSALHEGLHEFAGSDFRTYFDPAVRVPSISGSGGKADILSHWTYTYPDPQRIGLCADQLFAMAAANGRDQDVMKMTQLIWYRSETAPIKQAADSASKTPGAWDDHDPDAAYITIAPMHLREALWTKLSRPIKGIMYHGWQSLVETDDPSGYRYTNPHTQRELARLVREVVRPLGPTLLQVPGTKRDVAFFESFTSQMFARRGGWGYNPGPATDLWLALQHAHIQCDILYEETLLRDGLADRKVLVMSDCDVLTEPVVAAIAAWQKQGGKIVSDETLCPALKADLVVPRISRTKKNDVDKAKVLEIAEQLDAAAPKWGLSRDVDCDNREIVLQTRQAGDGLYLFTINDRREYGNYVGRYGLVMENGLPSTGTVRLPGNVHVYDLVAGTELTTQPGQAGTTQCRLDIGPCDGRLLLALPTGLGHVEVATADTVTRGKSVNVVIRVLDEARQPVQAVIPAEVQIRDANGQLAERSGFYGIKNGQLEIGLDIATNEDPGVWEISVRELASRRSASGWMRVVP